MRTFAWSLAVLFAVGVMARPIEGCDQKCDAAYSDCMTGCAGNPACIDPCKRSTCTITMCSDCWAPCL
ncbi:uncharacterized protein K452DRAFT_283121 [Aplosporella prunicola CBS 121167]|uniref:4Fe-4S ferredoxin-type domain-containing protein n=1 Tax=Aplosporella prunicola CBS 121167 TaxID=1176127 RepID=A0A6A6BSE2_9PEZI|nr:uncharacterized protein K452DRAFT_283121 [Aplosporella prunicola CBS 121167]KAF2146920.1 hypothetical protein K452DRAFT_283121 [Aplosporella prunicola CBS 121167]